MEDNFIDFKAALRFLGIGATKMCTKVNPWLAAKIKAPFYGKGSGKRYSVKALKTYVEAHCIKD